MIFKKNIEKTSKLLNRIKKAYSSILLFNLLVISIFFIPNNLYQVEVDENDLLIAYIERFTRFINNDKFPEFDNEKLPFNVYIFGKNRFGDKLEQAYKKQKIKNRSVQIFYTDNIESIKNANIIYLNSNTTEDIQKIIEHCNNHGILTISYEKGFGEKGIHINLFKKDNRLRFEINLKSAQNAGFKISHLLLSNAKIVE